MKNPETTKKRGNVFIFDHWVDELALRGNIDSVRLKSTVALSKILMTNCT